MVYKRVYESQINPLSRAPGLGLLWGVCRHTAGALFARWLEGLGGGGGGRGRGRLYFRGESELTRELDLPSVFLPFLHFLFNAKCCALASQQMRGHFV